MYNLFGYYIYLPNLKAIWDTASFIVDIFSHTYINRSVMGFKILGIGSLLHKTHWKRVLSLHSNVGSITRLLERKV